jgi:hypothetical protein
MPIATGSRYSPIGIGLLAIKRALPGKGFAAASFYKALIRHYFRLFR